MQENKEKIAFFDFCDTLVPFQSADAYVKYVLKHHKSLPMLMRRVFFVFLRNMHLLDWFLKRSHINHKAFVLWQLKGKSESVMREMAKNFYNERIVPSLVPETYGRLRDLQKQGYRVVLVSGGYDIYLHLFAADNDIASKDVLATELLFKEGLFTGKMGEDCMNESKIARLEKLFDREKIYSVAFSDSLSDLPLLTWCDEAYFVQHYPRQYKPVAQPELRLLYINK